MSEQRQDSGVAQSAPCESSAGEPTAAAVYARAAELVEQGWCKLAGARDDRGHPTFETSKRAVRWCATGAILRAIHDLTPDHRECWEGLHNDPLAPALRAAWLETDGEVDIPDWNNTRPHPRYVIDGLMRASLAAAKLQSGTPPASLAPESASDPGVSLEGEQT